MGKFKKSQPNSPDIISEIDHEVRIQPLFRRTKLRISDPSQPSPEEVIVTEAFRRRALAIAYTVGRVYDKVLSIFKSRRRGNDR